MLALDYNSAGPGDAFSIAIPVVASSPRGGRVSVRALYKAGVADSYKTLRCSAARGRTETTATPTPSSAKTGAAHKRSRLAEKPTTPTPSPAHN